VIRASSEKVVLGPRLVGAAPEKPDYVLFFMVVYSETQYGGSLTF
jgi:hypothetical protein